MTMTMWKRAVTFSLAIASICAQCPHEGSGGELWSQFGANFGVEEVVVIPAGETVLLDVSPPKLKSIEVRGSLVITDVDLALDVDWIRVHDGGSLIGGSEECRLTSEIVITFHGPRDEAGNEIGNSVIDSFSLGNKGLGVHSGGVVHLFGAQVSPAWTRLASTAQVGATSLTVDEAVEWSIGDQIVIASTDYAGNALAALYPFEQSEDRRIANISADRRTLTLDSALAYMHWGAGDQRAEVGLLTRNVRVQGDVSSDESLFGGHVMFRRADSAQFVGVEFTRMGQQGNNGRYPVHWHVTREAGQTAEYRVEDCAIHSSYQRCVTIHDTQNVLIKNNVCYNTFGHMYFLEDGSEIDNRFEGNLGVRAKPIAGDLLPRQLIPSDENPAVFWITNPNNTWVGNVASSASHGYWFSMPPKPNGATTEFYADSDIFPRNTPLQRFDQNTAHSLYGTGLLIDEMQRMDGSIEFATYNPREGGLDTSDVPVVAELSNFVAYKCRDRGIWTRGDSMRVTSALLMDNANGILMVPGPNIIESSVIIAETDNVGDVDGVPLWAGETDRSLPKWWTNKWPLMGFEMYDAGGPQFMRDVEFVNFQPNDNRMSAAIGHLFNGENVLFPDDRFEGLTFTNSHRMFIHNYPNSYAEDYVQRDGTRSLVFNDRDGSTTDMPGSWVVSNHDLYDARGDCTVRSDWNAMICPPSHQPFVMHRIFNLDVAGTDFAGTDISEDDPAIRATWYRFGDTSKSEGLGVYGHFADNHAQRDAYDIALPARTGYTIYWEHPTPPSLQLMLFAAAPGEWQVFAIPYPRGTTFTVTRYSEIPVTEVMSLDELTRETYFFDSDDELLYVRVEMQQSGQEREEWNFGYFVGWHFDAMVQVEASCPNGACAQRSVGDFAVPGALRTRTDSYRALLQPCQAGDDVVSSNSGEAFLEFDPESATLTWTIYHTLGANVEDMVVQFGLPGDTEGAVEIQVDFAQSPIRGFTHLSRRNWVDMFEGELHVTVSSSDYPSGELRGQIGCAGSCSVPSSISTQDPCAAQGSPIDLWLDGPLDQPGGWNSWSHVNETSGSSITFEYTDEEALCGDSSIFVDDRFGDAQVTLNIAWPYDRAFTVDPSVHSYLQFYARGLSWDVPIELAVMLTRSDSASPGEDVTDSGKSPDLLAENLLVGTQYVDNFVVEADWARVRIPLADLGVTQTEHIVRLRIGRYRWWLATNLRPITRQILIDQIQFVEDLPEEMTPPFELDAAPFSTDICADGAPARPEATTPPDSPDGIDGNGQSDQQSSAQQLTLAPVVYFAVSLSAFVF